MLLVLEKVTYKNWYLWSMLNFYFVLLFKNSSLGFKNA